MRSKSEKRKYTSARERAEKQSIGFTASYLKIPDGVQLFKPKAGRVLIDILPFTAGEGNPWAQPGNLHWERTYHAHRGVGANSDTFVCPRLAKTGKCPICEHRLRLMKEGDEDEEELVKDLAPRQRQIFNIIDLKNPDKGVQLWDMSYHLFGKVLDARLRNSDEEDEWDKFFFLEGGLTLKIGFIERSFGGYTFVEAETIDFKQRSEDYDEDILEKTHCLDELIVIPEYGDLKKAFLETGKEKDDDDDDEPKKKKKAPVDDDDDDDDEGPKGEKRLAAGEDDDDKPKSKKKSKEPDEDKDDWEDFDEDDDEPMPGGKGKKKKPVDDDDDDEDDYKPKGKKKPNRFAKQKGDKGWDTDDDDDDDEPKSKKKKSSDDDEDDE